MNFLVSLFYNLVHCCEKAVITFIGPDLLGTAVAKILISYLVFAAIYLACNICCLPFKMMRSIGLCLATNILQQIEKKNYSDPAHQQYDIALAMSKLSVHPLNLLVTTLVAMVCEIAFNFLMINTFVRGEVQYGFELTGLLYGRSIISVILTSFLSMFVSASLGPSLFKLALSVTRFKFLARLIYVCFGLICVVVLRMIVSYYNMPLSFVVHFGTIVLTNKELSLQIDNWFKPLLFAYS